MWIEVVKVIKPFLQFLQAYDSQQVHNMLALMFDPRFKYLKVVENYVGHGAYICLVAKYDANAIFLGLQNLNDSLHFALHFELRILSFYSWRGYLWSSSTIGMASIAVCVFVG